MTDQDKERDALEFLKAFTEALSEALDFAEEAAKRITKHVHSDGISQPHDDEEFTAKVRKELGREPQLEDAQFVVDWMSNEILRTTKIEDSGTLRLLRSSLAQQSEHGLAATHVYQAKFDKDWLDMKSPEEIAAILMMMQPVD